MLVPPLRMAKMGICKKRGDETRINRERAAMRNVYLLSEYKNNGTTGNKKKCPADQSSNQG
jgi:hypothetical protein